MATPALLDPRQILALDPAGADALLDRLERTVPVRPPLVEFAPPGAREGTVFGDTHGDWRSTIAAAQRFWSAPSAGALVGLGDYIDRPPEDCGEGSVANALLLLQWTAAFPERVLLIQGNHEAHRRIAVVPHGLAEEVDQLWGPEEARYLRLMALLERGPLAATTASGAFLAHGGFPRAVGSDPYPQEFRADDDEVLAEIVWGEPDAGRSRRGVVTPFRESDLDRFLARSGTRLFLRGHDPDLTGRPLYGGRCLTLHTCRLYQRFGGVIAARLPLDRTVARAGDLLLEHLATEGRVYPPVD